jgi:hypothetical protein
MRKSHDCSDHESSCGIRLTDEVLERLADEAERGYPTERLVRRAAPPPRHPPGRFSDEQGGNKVVTRPSQTEGDDPRR